MFDNISEIVQTIAPNEVNDLLNQGWKLLNVVQYKTEESARALYVLGNPRKAKTYNEYDALSL